MIEKASIRDRVSILLRDELLFDDNVDFAASIDDVGIDSIQLMQLFVYLEETFGFEFAEDSAPTKAGDLTLQAIVDYVHETLNGARALGSQT